MRLLFFKYVFKKNSVLTEKLEKLENELFVEKEANSSLRKNLSALSVQNELATKKLYEIQTEKTLFQSDFKIKFLEN